MWQMQIWIREKLEKVKRTAIETEQKQHEILKRVELENLTKLNKIKTLLWQQCEVGKEWEKEMSILRFKFSCKLDVIWHSTLLMEEHTRRLKVPLYTLNNIRGKFNIKAYKKSLRLQADLWAKCICFKHDCPRLANQRMIHFKEYCINDLL